MAYDKVRRKGTMAEKMLASKGERIVTRRFGCGGDGGCSSGRGIETH